MLCCSSFYFFHATKNRIHYILLRDNANNIICISEVMLFFIIKIIQFDRFKQFQTSKFPLYYMRGIKAILPKIKKFEFIFGAILCSF